MPTAKRIVVLAVLMLAAMQPAWTSPVLAKAKAFQEYQLKAVFLYHLTHFVSWPAGAFEHPGEPIRIIVLGQNPFGDLLHKVVDGERVQGRPIIVEHSETLAEMQSGQIVFVSSSLSDDLHQVVAAARSMGALIVGDMQDFAGRGGDVNLLRVGNRVAIEINVGSARQAGFGFSSKLLRIARIVGSASSQEVD